MADHQFHLPDMTCGHCVAAITEAIQSNDAQALLQFDREARKLSATSRLSRDVLTQVLTEAGYPPSAN